MLIVVVALQEVPRSIVECLEGLGRGEGFHVFWETCPSERDEVFASVRLLGQGCQILDLVPPVPMDMLFAKRDIVVRE